MKIRSLILRYVLMIVFGVFMNVFYLILTPLTLYPLYFLLSLFFQVSLTGNTIMANGTAIGLIDACIAGSAFYLLLILNLSTPKIKIKQRIFILLFDYFIFLVLNILRIFLLSILLINSSQIFYIVHLVFWYVISVILVLLIWIITVKLFKIKEAPFFSDIKELILYLKNSSS